MTTATKTTVNGFNTSQPILSMKFRKLEAHESYYQSEDRTVDINPLYCGRERPQGWEIVDSITRQRVRTYSGLKDAKEIGRRFLASRTVLPQLGVKNFLTKS